ncbi:MAG TPA: type II secretion system minor pseudopilin GspK [Rhizobacter sp.]|nr:type II secretion system minor pseudopilin GspK [Rhizobacter sp.]
MPRARQRGAALLLAMIIVTLISTLAVSMVWQQWRAVQVETAERSRAQSAWLLSGALDWVGLILKEDARPTSQGSHLYDHLGEPWAVPLAEARLSTFLAATDKDASTDDAPDAFLSGNVTDAQSRFNLRNLVDPATGQVSAPDKEVLRQLCVNLNVSPTVADVLVNGLRAANTPAGAPGASADGPLPPKRISQLTWLGVDAQALQRLEPYIVMLPDRTTVNVNTASREVIAAAIPGLNVGDAERLVQYRLRTPFKKHADIQAQLTGTAPESLAGVDVKSDFFEVRGRLRLSDRVLEQRSMVRRNQRNIEILSSERISSSDTGR